MNNQNNGKSKTRNQGNAPVRKMAPKQGSSSGKKNPQMRAKVNPGQTFRNKPERSGSGYDVQFDAISRMPSPDVRSEPFDENIGTLMGTAAFGTTAFAINPAQALSFPRLSKIAALYERYRFKRLEFYFLHDVGPYATQGQTGLVLLSVLFDAASAAPTTKVQIEATNPRVICMPNQNSLLRVPVKQLHPKGEPLYLRPGQLPGGTDIKTYDAGNFFATVQGMVGTGEVGELHVRGEVEFIDFLLDSSLTAAPTNNQVVVANSTAGEAQTTATPYTLLFAGTQTGSLGLVNSSGVLQLPAGNFLIDCNTETVFTGLGTQVSMILEKNGVSIAGNAAPGVVFTSGSLTKVPLSSSVFLSSDGTSASALTCVTQSTFSTGTATVYGTLRVTAV
jgi:hypothetical protein